MGIVKEGQNVLRFVVGLLICCLSICNADNNRYLYVPSLGRSAEIGYLYNARLDEFRDASVFRNSQYKEAVTEIQTPRSTMESTTSNSFDDISELLGIDTDTAASILSGWLTKKHIGGAAGVLKRTLENPLEPDTAATLILKHQTVEQSLPLWYDQLKDLYNTDILAHKEATHIVSGIIWGGSLSIKFRDDATPAREQADFHASLNAIFLKLEGTMQTSNETFNFATSVNSDITLPKIEISSTRDVMAITNEFENRLQNLNGGKGVPVMYRLTPLGLIQKHMKVENAPNITAHGITTTAFKRFVRIFEDTWNSQNRLNELYTDVSSKPNCILPENLEKIKELRSTFAEYKETLTDKFKQVLFDVRSGILEMSALSDLAQEYKAGNYNSKMINSKLAEFYEPLKKFEFCKAVENSENNIEYFGSRQDLLSIIYQNSGDKNIYLFFTKTEFAKNDAIKYTENLNYFLKTLQMPSNKLLIVDCDFIHDVCDKISEPTIYEYKNNHVTSKDFKQTVYDEQMNLQEQINELKNNLTALKSITEIIEQTYEPKHFCSPNKCLNGGSCVDADDDFECICQTGYEGRKCEKQTNLCESSPCFNNGVCYSGFNSYRCACAAGFQGPTCAEDINVCASTSNKTVCKNGGKCIEEADGFTCACQLSWAGKTCQQKLDPCPLNRCENGATCNPSADLLSSTCTCMSGYTGAYCENDVNECAMDNSLCRNGGSCQNTNGSYTCSCAPIYEGNNCEIVTSDCLRNNDCTNGATCEDTIENSSNQSSHRCLCAAGFTGSTCNCNLGSQNVASLKVVKITECGGLVKIPDLPSATSFLLDYKSNVADTNQERCLWTLDTTKGDRSYVLKVRVTLLCDGFNNYSSGALSVLGWQWESLPWISRILTHNVLSKDTPKYEQDQYDYKLFLHYMSTNARHSGFILRVDVLTASSSHPGSNFVSKISARSQSQSFGPYKTNDVFSMMVISPQTQTNFTLTVDNLDSKKTGFCHGNDVLHIYKIKSVRSSDTIAKLCGSVTTPISYTSAHPIVVLYYTADSTTGRGFSLTWE